MCAFENCYDARVYFYYFAKMHTYKQETVLWILINARSLKIAIRLINSPRSRATFSNRNKPLFIYVFFFLSQKRHETSPAYERKLLYIHYLGRSSGRKMPEELGAFASKSHHVFVTVSIQFYGGKTGQKRMRAIRNVPQETDSVKRAFEPECTRFPHVSATLTRVFNSSTVSGDFKSASDSVACGDSCFN